MAWSAVAPAPQSAQAGRRCALRRAASMAAAFVRRDNIRHRSDIENAYLEAIDSAKDEIMIANAYFLPGRRIPPGA